jgi:hypothetical protein
MLGIISLQAFNLMKAVRTSYWTTIENAERKLFPVATVSFAIYVEGSQTSILLQFRGEQAIKKLKLHFESHSFNAMNISGHLEQFRLPAEGDDLSYGAMTQGIEDLTSVSGNGIMTTVIVVDNFDSSIGVNPYSMKEMALLAGNEWYDVGLTPSFAGVVKVNTSILNDGPKYNFGRSNSRSDETKVRYSVSGITQHGSNSMAKLRVEIHGENRVNIFENLVKRNNALFLSGSLVVYNSETGAQTYAVWVNQFLAFNMGSVESIGNVNGFVTIDGLDTPVTKEDAVTPDESWVSTYGDSSAAGGNLFATFSADSKDIPF